jgi:hypothetical protein
MDPTIALATMRTDDDADMRRDAAIALRDWLLNGGFVPDGEDRSRLLAECVVAGR